MKTACESFREHLEYLSRQAKRIEDEDGERFHCHPGDLLQDFDEIHQSCRESTGGKCQVTDWPVIIRIMSDKVKKLSDGRIIIGLINGELVVGERAG